MPHVNSPGAVASFTPKHKVFSGPAAKPTPLDTSMTGLPLTRSATASSSSSSASASSQSFTWWSPSQSPASATAASMAGSRSSSSATAAQQMPASAGTSPPSGRFFMDAMTKGWLPSRRTSQTALASAAAAGGSGGMASSLP